MPDATTVPANAGALPGSVVRQYDAGGSGAVLDCVYINQSDGDVEQTDCNAAATSHGIGIVVGAISNMGQGKTTFVANDPLSVALWGPITGFSGLTPGRIYWVDSDAGKLTDTQPSGGGTWSRGMGYALTATEFFVMPGITAPLSNS